MGRRVSSTAAPSLYHFALPDTITTLTVAGNGVSSGTPPANVDLDHLTLDNLPEFQAADRAEDRPINQSSALRLHRLPDPLAGAACEAQTSFNEPPGVPTPDQNMGVRLLRDHRPVRAGAANDGGRSVLHAEGRSCVLVLSCGLARSEMVAHSPGMARPHSLALSDILARPRNMVLSRHMARSATLVLLACLARPASYDPLWVDGSLVRSGSLSPRGSLAAFGTLSTIGSARYAIQLAPSLT
jgi:hypothetical protein